MCYILGHFHNTIHFVVQQLKGYDRLYCPKQDKDMSADANQSELITNMLYGILKRKSGAIKYTCSSNK